MTSFDDLIRDEDPAAMEVAEDLLLERGWKLREVTGGLHASNFTIALRPMWLPGDQWKMVQTRVFQASPTRAWVTLTAANGPSRVQRQLFCRLDLDLLRVRAVANAWAIAKAVKRLPLNSGPWPLEDVVDQYFYKNPQPTNLYLKKKPLLRG